ncbi:MAG: hypothetical protein AB1749_17005 [Pseudomonadota bacterium]
MPIDRDRQGELEKLRRQCRQEMGYIYLTGSRKEVREVFASLKTALGRWRQRGR